MYHTLDNMNEGRVTGAIFLYLTKVLDTVKSQSPSQETSFSWYNWQCLQWFESDVYNALVHLTH